MYSFQKYAEVHFCFTRDPLNFTYYMTLWSKKKNLLFCTPTCDYSFDQRGALSVLSQSIHTDGVLRCRHQARECHFSLVCSYMWKTHLCNSHSDSITSFISRVGTTLYLYWDWYALPGATTSAKVGPCPFSGVPVTRYPEMGPTAGLQRTVIVLSFTSVTSISDGDSISMFKETKPIIYNFLHSTECHTVISHPPVFLNP